MPAVEKAKQFVEGHMNGKPDAYTLAVMANFAADYAAFAAAPSPFLQLILVSNYGNGWDGNPITVDNWRLANPVPEPASAGVLAAAGLLALRRRRA